MTEPRSNRLPAAAAALCLCAPPVAGAAPDADDDPVDIVVAGDALVFDYRELGTDGRELNHESGVLPGVRLTARTTRDRTFARIDASFHGGEVDYDGETQSGTPTQTDTGTRLLSFGAEVGGWLGPRPGQWGVFLRLARRLWERDIYSTGSAQGIYEEYRWSEIGLGLRHAWRAAEDADWHHEISATGYATMDGDVFVGLSGLNTGGPEWDDRTLDLGGETGLRVRYTATRALASNRVLRIEPYFAYWEFGRSPERTVTADGSPADCDSADPGFQGCTVHEPRSESMRLGVSMGLVF